MYRFILVLILATAIPANAAPPSAVSPVMSRLKFTSAGATCATSTGACKVLDGIALNASSSSRTFTLPVSGYSKLTVQANLTRSAATDLQLICTASLDGGSTYGSITSTSVSGGTGTVSAYHDVITVGASGNYLLEYDTRTYDYIKCVVSGTSGGSSDTVTIYAVAAVGQ
jgi:hypothetical protein